MFAALLGQDCVLCGGASVALVCRGCRAGLPVCLYEPLVPRAFDDVWAAYDYRFPVDRLVRRFKFAGDLAIGRWLGERLAARVHGAGADVIVAPPSTRARLRERGFNPALEIAKVVARRRRIPVALEGLRRVRETAPQPGLARASRRRNLEGAFACGIDVRGRHVAIVDDVLTTGATVEAAATVLKAAGAARVSVWVVARAP
jgi:ComF family protein